MLYQLTDGRVVEISTEDYFNFTDEELNSLLGYNCGDYINNPMYGSAMQKRGRPSEDDEPFYGEQDINDVPDEVKYRDQDYTADEE